MAVEIIVEELPGSYPIHAGLMCIRYPHCRYYADWQVIRVYKKAVNVKRYCDKHLPPRFREQQLTTEQGTRLVEFYSGPPIRSYLIDKMIDEAKDDAQQQVGD